MFVLELEYCAPLEQIDALLPAHVEWLDQQYSALVATDPFVVRGVCAYRVTEFVASKPAEDLAAYRESPNRDPQQELARG